MSLLKMQYILEKEDVYHREEQNLMIYLNYWHRGNGRFLTSDFFNWLDYGEGRYVDLDLCSRRTLDRERVTYVGDGNRKPYRVIFDENGTLVFKATGMAVHTRNHKDTIYVLSAKWKFYVADKVTLKFHHSSFMSGGDVYCAGHLHVTDGWLESLSYTSGHYKPTERNFELVKDFLYKQNVNLTFVEYK